MYKNNDNNIPFLIRPTIDDNASIRYTGTIKKEERATRNILWKLNVNF